MNEKLVKNVLHFMRYGAIAPVWSWLSIAIIKLGGPKLAAYMSYLTIDWGGMKHSKTILCLHRESFVKDVVELRKRTNLNYPMVTGGYTRFQMVWFPESMQIQTFYKLHKHKNDKAIKLGLEYARQLLHLVNKKYTVDAMLSANFDYWQDLGFKIACKELGIPFLVLSREHVVIPKASDEVIEWYKQSSYQFEGTAIAVAGHSTKNAILAVDTLCVPEQVKVTGLPRYDAWLDIDTSIAIEDRPYITLLTFTEGYYADQTFEEVLELFCNAAKIYTDSTVKFFIKSKDAADTQRVHEILKQNDLPGLECSHEKDLFDVLPKSRIVINYNSLALVEAVMAKARVVIPVWGECKDGGKEVLYAADNPKVAKVVEFAYSPSELKDLIASCILNQSSLASTEDIRDFIDEFIHIPEHGTYSGEFENFVTPYLS